MSELLAPAGSMEALRAAIANGCDAVYLGMQKFGARAYSANFSEQELAEAVAYAHIRGVKVYVTVNTIVFQDELEDVYRQLHFLNGLGVDGVIAQDLAVLTYVARNFCDMEAHCSTQMGSWSASILPSWHSFTSPQYSPAPSSVISSRNSAPPTTPIGRWRVFPLIRSRRR